MDKRPCECGNVNCRLRLDNGRCARVIGAEVSERGAMMPFSEMADLMGLKSHQHAEQIYNRALGRFCFHALGMDLETLLEELGEMEPRVARLLNAHGKNYQITSSI